MSEQESKPKRRPSDRPRLQVRRVLHLIDVLAPRHQWLSTADVYQLTNESGETPVCERTVMRDLQLLDSMNMIERKVGPGRQPGSVAVYWRLSIDRSWSLQRAAIKVFSEERRA